MTVAANFLGALLEKKLWAEAKQFARTQLRVVQQAVGHRHECSFALTHNLANALASDPAASRADLLEAHEMIAEARKTAMNALGPHHPFVRDATTLVEAIRTILSLRPP